jgi:RHS repeat-associated protein
VAPASVHLSDWVYVQSLGAKIVTDTNTGVRTRNFTYDPAGRLAQTVEGAATRRYAYDADANRCALAAACDATWGYNAADQLTASPQATAYTYNSHGQLSAAARVDGKTENIGYAANDHAATIDDGTTTVAETLAPGGRVLERKVTDDTTHNLSEDTLYGYAGSGDSPAYTRAAAGGAVTSYLGACVDVAGTATWQIRNGHGDVVGTTDAAGGYSANPATDEFGIGTAPASRLGYLGGAERFTTDTNLGIIRMGARLYDPSLGRFLQTDPIPGGSANNYDYANQDPINGFDLGGDISFCSDDYCGAAQAIQQAGNGNSPLNQSEYWYGVNWDYTNKLWTHTRAQPHHKSFWHTVSRVAGYVAVATAVAGIGVAAIASGPEDLVVFTTVSVAVNLASASTNCAAKGFGTRSCLAGVGIATASVATGFLPVPNATSARLAAQMINLAWAGLSDLTSR